MIRRAVAGLGLTVVGLSACSGLPMLTPGAPAYESTACGMTPEGPGERSWFYPAGQRVTCLRVLTALAALEAAHRKGELSELVVPDARGAAPQRP